jgi:hypothetical protein
MLNLVYDRCVLGRPYPNLAPLIDARNGYHGLGDEYPWIAPIRLYYYAQDHGLSITINYIDQPLPTPAFYPVGISWFDFSLDFFALMSDRVCDLLRQGLMRVLFYYHEGDNPAQQKQRLDFLCSQHNLPATCYWFVSGNTLADELDQFVYFADHELFYWRNSVVWNDIPQIGCEPHSFSRNRDFTLLSRVHKWWRATVTSYLYREQLLGNSYWSYGNVDIGDQFQDNPIQLAAFPELEDYMREFLNNGPYRCDNMDHEQHNSHWMFVPEHYADSYCHLVLETFFDADGSNRCFISEKVFKPIRHGQPFVVFGTPYTLKTLRQLGYRTFDNHIDNSYDEIEDNTERFKRVVSSVQQIKQRNLHQWYCGMLDELEYNRARFISSEDKLKKLQALVKKIL